jgi:hypothetical protein
MDLDRRNTAKRSNRVLGVRDDLLIERTRRARHSLDANSRRDVADRRALGIDGSLPEWLAAKAKKGKNEERRGELTARSER